MTPPIHSAPRPPLRVLLGLGLLAAAALLAPVDAPAQSATEPGAGSAAAAQSQHARARSSMRIVGGRDVLEDVDPVSDWNFIASLEDAAGHFCGASLVHPNIRYDAGGPYFAGWLNFRDGPPPMAITAAHCVFDVNGALLEVGSESPLRVRAGALDISGSDGWKMPVLAIVPHPGFGTGRTGLENDIAVLILGPPEGRGKELNPIALPRLADATRYQQVTAAISVNGWGRTSEGGPFSPTLKTVRLPYSDQFACQDHHGRIGLDVTEGSFCAGFITGGADSCNADSGGGAIFKRTRTDGFAQEQNMLVGVVSWGVGCARYGLQGIYTDVLPHVHWLERVAVHNHDLMQ
ncbi:MAG: serine protease [Pseudomonadota bacterium]